MLACRLIYIAPDGTETVIDTEPQRAAIAALFQRLGVADVLSQFEDERAEDDLSLLLRPRTGWMMLSAKDENGGEHFLRSAS